MNSFKLILPLMLGTLSVLSQACNNDLLPGDGDQDNWLIPIDEVFDGGPGKDGIPSVDNPKFINVDQVSFLENRDLVVAVSLGNEVRAYPHIILDWHEIVNDEIDNQLPSVIYCPLTGTATVWDRNTSAGTTTFGVSGLLYNTNVIPYDRNTDSNWSQIYLKAVSGDLKGERAKSIRMIETRWSTFKTMYPNAKVMSTNTGFNRNYGVYPYGDYRTNHNSVIFPVSVQDGRLPGKERVLSVIFDDRAKAYPIKSFTDDITLIEDSFQDDLIIVGSQSQNFAIAFINRNETGDKLNFTVLNDEFPLVMQDDEGNKWDIFGKAQEGPRAGQALPYPNQMIGYWFSFPSFYPDLELYDTGLN